MEPREIGKKEEVSRDQNILGTGRVDMVVLMMAWQVVNPRTQ